MKLKDQQLLTEKRELLVEGMQKVLNELDLGNLRIAGLTLESSQADDDDDWATFAFNDIRCPPGFVLRIKFDPFTGRPVAVCEKV
ncbi:hypothetical protein Runsl_3339 [Runella slithyformis DSM 19594]|uniref:Uncharacterized protein n=1 Tax=Runella slithyformis (strain ATCC 29530 / DSM 19594 / LMG 11500 / NCIMB 11436 / LSU 4) TaxID=761193 RepID=A0A7U3ZM16_RUNSL|nr:hypothetical protein [Runella slithyformis]AEI49707.1 hypothetical protein Runsl_3339 [Runella slithyformis DSM 19594]